MICKNCGHNGDMHSDGECTLTSECFIELKPGVFCDCKEFVPVLEDER